MKQLNKRQRQALATKLKITEKAMELIKTYGLDSIKVTDICESANISVGAFYHYFNSKQDLIENAYMKIDLLVEKMWKVYNMIVATIRLLKYSDKP